MRNLSRNRSIVPALAVAMAALAVVARAQDLPTGYGVTAPSGSLFTTQSFPAGDADDYTFPAFPGTTLTVMVKPSKVTAPAKAFVPAVQFVRPDGTIADDDSGFVVSRKGTEAAGQTVTGTMTLDAPGWWQVRVRGKDLAAPTVPPAPVNPPEYSTGGYSVSITYKAPPTRPTLPVTSKSFTTKNAEISSKSDTDDYTFEGYPGMTISATATKPKASALIPGLTLSRPDGTIVAGGNTWNGKNAAISTKAGANDQGTWHVRVFGVDPSVPIDPKAPKNTTGAYTLAVKLGKPPIAPSLKPDGNHQYRLLVPAAEKVTLSYTLSFKGAAPVFNSFVDPNGKAVGGFNGGVKLTNYRVPDNLPIGNYVLTFDAPAVPPTNVTFASKSTAPSIMIGKAKKITLAQAEPIILINGVVPTNGGSNNTTRITVNTTGSLIDPTPGGDPSKVRVYIDHRELDPATTQVTGTAVQATVPAGLTLGFHDVVVQTTTGQVAVAAGAFEIVPPPQADSIDPVVGSVAGGYPMTISGSGFSKLADPQIVIDALTSNSIVPVHIDSVTDTEIKFIAPNYGAPGKKTFGVIDNRNGSNGDLLPLESFEFVSSPAINRLVPNLTNILGGDLISVTGANFQPTDHVYLEKTPGSGQYDELFNTFQDSTRHAFTAPVKPKGVYNVYVVDQFFQPLPPRVRPLTYYKFTDLSTTLAGMFPSGADVWDASTVAVADFNKDGYDDVFLSRVGGAAVGTSSHTRVLKNDALVSGRQAGQFSDVTAEVMPDITTTDDWRADRIWATDVNQDTWPDIVIVTNATVVLPDTSSHVRILINEALNGAPNSPRVFHDRTAALMVPVRMANPLYGGTAGVADNWRGLDMWVGDVDKGPSAPPEILITHQNTKQELDVSCTPWCSSPFSSGYTYGFYWGGSRAFFWDKNANGGLGRYKFEHNFFPRKSGLRVPVVTPGGVQIPICNQQYGQPCVDRFTPFLGKRIAVGDLNGDNKPDVAVVSDLKVERIYPPSTAKVTISSTQAAINKFNSLDGATVTDVTDKITQLGGDWKGDAIEIGAVGFPDGNSYGSIVISKAIPAGAGSAMRIAKFRVGAGGPVGPFDFEEITSNSVPTSGTADVWEASKIIFKDVDNDGDPDMAIVAPTAPGGTGPAFRILRNDISGNTAGVFSTKLMPLVQDPYLPLSANEHYEGDTMAIGDFNKDGATDFIVIRADATKPSPEARIIVIDKKN